VPWARDLDAALVEVVVGEVFGLQAASGDANARHDGTRR